MNKAKVYSPALWVFFMVLTVILLPQAHAEKRIALVIGNAEYKDAPLTNPVNDAVDMSAALKQAGFEVSIFTDIDRKQMRQAIRDFGDNLRKADVGLFYFAGHGIQVKGRNYLVPLGADVHSADEVQDESIDASAVLRKMESAGNAVNIVVLDACRNNPFARSFRSLERGLARMDGPVGSFIAYATAPGSVAADGNGRNGLYTQYLLEALGQPGLTIEQMFKRVRSGVTEATQGQQIPWESSSLLGEFVFLPGAQTVTAQQQMSPPPPASFKYLQVITNVPGASVAVNNVERGIIGDDGILNIANLTDDEAEITIRAEGHATKKEKVTLKSGQWEQLYVTLESAEHPQTPEIVTHLERNSADSNCIAGKRLLLRGKIVNQQDGDEQVKRNAPALQSSIIRAFRPFGVEFIDANIVAELKRQAVREGRKVRELLTESHADYLLNATVNMSEIPITLIKTNMKTVNATITMELTDVKTQGIVASVSHSVNKAGLDPRQVVRQELEKNMPELSNRLIRQVCAN